MTHKCFQMCVRYIYCTCITTVVTDTPTKAGMCVHHTKNYHHSLRDYKRESMIIQRYTEMNREERLRGQREREKKDG